MYYNQLKFLFLAIMHQIKYSVISSMIAIILIPMHWNASESMVEVFINVKTTVFTILSPDIHKSTFLMWSGIRSKNLNLVLISRQSEEVVINCIKMLFNCYSLIATQQ